MEWVLRGGLPAKVAAAKAVANASETFPPPPQSSPHRSPALSEARFSQNVSLRTERRKGELELKGADVERGDGDIMVDGVGGAEELGERRGVEGGGKDRRLQFRRGVRRRRKKGGVSDETNREMRLVDTDHAFYDIEVDQNWRLPAGRNWRGFMHGGGEEWEDENAGEEKERPTRWSIGTTSEGDVKMVRSSAFPGDRSDRKDLAAAWREEGGSGRPRDRQGGRIGGGARWRGLKARNALVEASINGFASETGEHDLSPRSSLDIEEARSLYSWEEPPSASVRGWRSNHSLSYRPKPNDRPRLIREIGRQKCINDLTDIVDASNEPCVSYDRQIFDRVSKLWTYVEASQPSSSPWELRTVASPVTWSVSGTEEAVSSTGGRGPASTSVGQVPSVPVIPTVSIEASVTDIEEETMERRQGSVSRGKSAALLLRAVGASVTEVEEAMERRGGSSKRRSGASIQRASDASRTEIAEEALQQRISYSSKRRSAPALRRAAEASATEIVDKCIERHKILSSKRRSGPSLRRAIAASATEKVEEALERRRCKTAKRRNGPSLQRVIEASVTEIVEEALERRKSMTAKRRSGPSLQRAAEISDTDVDIAEEVSERRKRLSSKHRSGLTLQQTMEASDTDTSVQAENGERRRSTPSKGRSGLSVRQTMGTTDAHVILPTEGREWRKSMPAKRRNVPSMQRTIEGEAYDTDIEIMEKGTQRQQSTSKQHSNRPTQRNSASLSRFIGGHNAEATQRAFMATRNEWLGYSRKSVYGPANLEAVIFASEMDDAEEKLLRRRSMA